MEKLRYLDFLNPIHIVWRRGTNDDPYVNKTDIVPVINQRVVLTEIPDKLNKVVIDGFNEINYKKYEKDSLKEDEFYVDYANGIVHFHRDMEAKTLALKYKGRGFILYPSTRIYYHDKNTDTVLNLNELIESVNNRLEVLGVAHEDLDRLKQQLYDAIDENNTSSDHLKQIIEQGISAVQLVESAYKTTQLIYKPYVQTYDDLLSEYPYPEVGWVAMVYETGERFRWNGAEWIPIDILGGNVPLANEYIDGLLSSEDYIKLQEITGETHTKVIVFLIPQQLLTGVQEPHILFPFDGKIENITASVSKSGSSNTAIRIEKSRDYENWSNLMITPLIIEKDEYFDNGNYTLVDEEVNKGDIFRLYVPHSSDVSNLSLNIEINIRKGDS